jgi:hypothetical protein
MRINRADTSVAYAAICREIAGFLMLLSIAVYVSTFLATIGVCPVNLGKEFKEGKLDWSQVAKVGGVVLALWVSGTIYIRTLKLAAQTGSWATTLRGHIGMALACMVFITLNGLGTVMGVMGTLASDIASTSQVTTEKMARAESNLRSAQVKKSGQAPILQARITMWQTALGQETNPLNNAIGGKVRGSKAIGLETQIASAQDDLLKLEEAVSTAALEVEAAKQLVAEAESKVEGPAAALVAIGIPYRYVPISIGALFMLLLDVVVPLTVYGRINSLYRRREQLHSMLLPHERPDSAHALTGNWIASAIEGLVD